ncbi:MAG: AgmX/PglI C-terminal domain-containing protein [Polyangia bacterium]
MGTFTMRRLILSATLLFCQVALADGPKPTEQKPTESQPELPFKLLSAIKPVSLEEVDRVVEANDRAVQSCNRNARRIDTLAVMMTMTIDADGKVTAVEAAPEDQDGGKLPAEASCLMRVAKKLKFPAAGTVSHVSYPFMIVSRVKPALPY